MKHYPLAVASRILNCSSGWSLQPIYISQGQPSRGDLRKMCSENMQQMYRKTPMSKCDFNKVAKRLY